MNIAKLGLGVIAGALAAFAVAVLWAAITAATHFQIGYMAIGVGFAVAFAVRIASQSHGRTQALLSAALSLFGCLVGNYLTATAILAAHVHADVVGISIALLPKAPGVIAETFNLMDLVFYAIGVYFGYKYALVPLQRPTPADTVPQPE
jgi:hypothetical protein